jgi:hypothetical protein
MKSTCRGISKGGERCLASPLRDSDFCFWHDPDHAEEADKARSLGGQRRRREKITEGAYDLQGLDTIEGIRRVVEVALLDLMGMENSVARSRTLISGALAAAKLIEVGEQEERLQALEAALGPRVVKKGRR